MISEEKFEELFSLAEDIWIDFKAEPHQLDIDHFKSEFIEDILCMANTPRESSAYIIIGVKLHEDGSHENIGVTQHPDDSDLQDIVNNAKLEQKPRFVYQTINYNGKSYGILEIPIQKDGPYYPTKDFGVLKAHRLYFRRGTKNDEASTSVEKNMIFRWFNPPKPILLDLPSNYSSLNWDRFYQECHNFDENRLYLFVVGPNQIKPAEIWSQLIKVPTNLIFDFDPNTNKENGIYYTVKPYLEKICSLHLISIQDRPSFNPEKACYWYATKGFSEIPETVVIEDWRSWNRKYGRAIQEFLVEYARSANGKPLTVICLWHAPEYLHEICSTIDRTFGEAADYIFAFPEAEYVKTLASQFSGSIIPIRTEDILFGFQNNLDSKDAIPVLVGLPDNNSDFRAISPTDLNWLSEDMEVLHSNIDAITKNDLLPGLDYLRGHTINWNDLNLHIDADRDETGKLENLISRDLETRTPTRLNIYHYPGGGGSTIARRIGWNLRRKYPTVLLKRIIPGETIGKMRFIFSLTNQPILAIVEGSDVVPDQIEQFYTEIRAEQIPLILLSILRRFELSGSNRDRSIFVSQILSPGEIYRFVQTYKRVTPEKEGVLEKFLDINGAGYHTPFYIGLVCFEENFAGLQKYIELRLNNAQQFQKELLTLISLVYYYGHRPISAQIFANLLGIQENKVVNLNQLLPTYLLDLLIKEHDNEWRPTHQLISEEVIKVVLSYGLDRRNWSHNLSSWAIKLINLCEKSSLLPTNEIVDLLRRVFILRDEYELLGTESSDTSEYSKYIEDIPTVEGKLVVLKELVNCFPGEAHFWGHLSRFYSTTMKEFKEALGAINEAINIKPGDPVLFHMKGMCYRKISSSRMKEIRENDQSQHNDEVIKDLVEKSKEAFSKARELDPSSEHAYISPIQLLLSVLDFGYHLSGFSTKTEWLTSGKSQWYREQLDDVENLLEQGRFLREGERPSRFIVDCQSKLDLVYDNYSKALEGWQNLLSRKDIYAPPIRRQIIRMYLIRQNRQWSNIQPNEVERIIDLAEQNLLEEPGSTSNIRMWFQAIRYSKRQDIDQALVNLMKWKSFGGSIEAYYYTYILHALKAIDGSTMETEITKDQIKESSEKARGLRNHTRSFEWFGIGKGLNRIVHYSALGEWVTSTDFYEKTNLLDRLEGFVIQIKGPEAGIIKLIDCGLEAFFVPGKAGFYKGKDENRRVNFYLGFSYDGLRAWNVALSK